MSTPLPRLVCVETVGDLPVLWACLQRLRLVPLLDQHFPTPPRWAGDLSCGEVLAVWLLFVALFVGFLPPFLFGLVVLLSARGILGRA